MRTITFFRLRFLVNFVFVILMFLIPALICKNYENQGLDIDDYIQIWLMTDGLILILQTIINQFLKTIPIIPDVIPVPPKEHKNNE